MNPTFATHLAMIDRRTIGGYAIDNGRPGRHLVVEILADGVPVAAVVADTFNSALARAGHDDANHGFVHTLADRLVASTRLIAARIANLDFEVGNVIDLDAAPIAEPLQAIAGMIETVDDDTIRGWVMPAAGVAAMPVDARIAGDEVAATIARTFASRPIGGDMRSVLTFALKLPRVLLDGQPHVIDVATSSNLALAGSPVRLPAENGEVRK